MASISSFINLTKPGIIGGNAIAAAAGFFLASRGQPNLRLFVAMLMGLSLIIASACVFNNYLDRGIDVKMARTKRRALATGRISGRTALIYAAILGLLGATILAIFTNPLTLGLALFGLFAYVVLYGLGKRRSVHGTLIGSLSGAAPPVVGYCAVTNHFDLGALILFLILIFWQMPHFYSIAIYRQDDYAAAGLPVLPVKRGRRAAKIQSLIYIVAFMAAAFALTVFNYTGLAYLGVAAILGLGWLGLSIEGFWASDTRRWARHMFTASLVVLTVLCVAMSLNPV